MKVRFREGSSTGSRDRESMSDTGSRGEESWGIGDLVDRPIESGCGGEKFGIERREGRLGEQRGEAASEEIFAALDLG